MKRHSVFVFLLLTQVSSAAQTRLPTLKDAQIQQSNEGKPYEGLQISSIEFRGNKHFSSETLRDFIKSKEGTPYDADKLNFLGLFEQLSFEDAAFHVVDPNKLDITIRLREKGADRLNDKEPVLLRRKK